MDWPGINMENRSNGSFNWRKCCRKFIVFYIYSTFFFLAFFTVDTHLSYREEDSLKYVVLVILTIIHAVLCLAHLMVVTKLHIKCKRYFKRRKSSNRIELVAIYQQDSGAVGSDDEKMNERGESSIQTVIETEPTWIPSIFGRIHENKMYTPDSSTDGHSINSALSLEKSMADQSEEKGSLISTNSSYWNSQSVSMGTTSNEEEPTAGSNLAIAECVQVFGQGVSEGS